MKAKRLLSLLLALALVMGIAPVVSQTAQAAENTGGKAIRLGTGGIVGPEEKTTRDGNHYTPNSYVWFGVNGDDTKPIQWRVLDAEKANDGKTAGAFLLSEYLLGTGVNGGVYFEENIHQHGDGKWYQGGDDVAEHGKCLEANVYQNSDAQAWCRTFASNRSNFSDLEQAAMLGVKKTDSAEGGLYGIRWGESDLTTADKVFFLSVRELADHVGNYDKAPGLTASFNDGGSAGVWWLRSPDADYTYNAGAVYDVGLVNFHYVDIDWAARPAFNLNLESVLFTSAAAGGKIPAAGGGGNGGEAAGEIFEIQPYTGNEWKLTLKDESRKFSVTETAATAAPGGTVTLNYTGATVYDANTAPNEYISAILTDENGNLLRYGRLTQPTSANGKVDVKIPAGLAEGTYTLKVFSEQYNGDKQTDYAGAFDEVELTVRKQSVTVTITGRNNSAAYDGTEHSVSGYDVTISDPSYTETDFTFSGTAEANRTDAGTTNMGLAASQFRNTNGNFDVTFDVTDGYVTISKAELTIKAKDQTCIYNGQIQGPGDKLYASPDEIAEVIKVEGLLPGHKVANVTVSGQGKEVGTYEDWLGLIPSSARIVDTNGNTVSSNYDRDYVSGTLTITPAPLTVTTGSATKEYDGTPLTAAGEITGLVNGETATVSATGEQLYVGSSENGYTIDWGATKASNYEISENLGTLTVEKANPVITGVSVTAPTPLYDTTAIGDIVLGFTSDPSGGTLTLDGGQTLTVGTNDYNWTYTPADTANYNTVTGTVSVTVTAAPIYTVTFDPNGGKVTPASGTTGTDGKLTTLPTPTRTNYTFDGWYTEETGGTRVDENYAFSGNTTIYARWTYTGGGGGGGVAAYAITIEKPENGSLNASRTTATSGMKITLTATPDEGFETDTVKVTDRSGREIAVTKNDDGTYSFTMPGGKVNVTATFKAKAHDCPSAHLKDVDENAWYHEYIDYVVEKGLMQGVADDLFAPNVTTSRAMIVTILYRLEGRPAVSGASPFDDVASGQWYTDAIIWANSEGIVEGYGDGKFGTDDNITREQFAAILYRYAKFKGYDVSVGQDTNILSYDDAFEVSDWAMEAMQWAVGSGLITGRTETTLVPKGDATRAEAAAILMRYIENTK